MEEVRGVAIVLGGKQGRTIGRVPSADVYAQLIAEFLNAPVHNDVHVQIARGGEWVGFALCIARYGLGRANEQLAARAEMINHGIRQGHAQVFIARIRRQEPEGEHCNGTLAGKSRWEESPQFEFATQIGKLAQKISGALK